MILPSEKSKPPKFGAFDIEIVNDKFARAWTFDGDITRQFSHPERLLDYLLARRFRGWTWYIHDGGRYDLLTIFRTLVSSWRGKKISLVMKGERVFQIKFMDGNNIIKITDSRGLLNFDFEKLCVSFGFPIPGCTENCAVTLFGILKKFYGRVGVNPRGQTIASVAMRWLRENKLNREICGLPPRMEHFTRRALYGGRCEVVKFYGEWLNHYDIISYYASLMLEKLPVGQPFFTRRLDLSAVGFYDVTLAIPFDYICPLPFNSGCGLRIFPCGRFRGVFSTVELSRLRPQSILKVHDGLLFGATDNVLAEYARHWFLQKKNAGNEVDYLIAKLMLNSLIGKFAQRRDLEKVTEFSVGTKEAFPRSNLDLGKSKTFSRSPLVMPAITAWITALGRCRMLDLIGTGDDVFYFDTDSLFTTREMQTGTEAGELKLVGKIRSAAFANVRTYAVEYANGERVIKASGQSAESIPFESVFDAVIENNPARIVSRYSTFLSLRQSLAVGNGNRNGESLLRRYTKETEARVLYRGRLRVFGNETVPRRIES
jgi:hypothetical protein